MVTRRQPLTARQRQVYDFIQRQLRRHGVAPTLREIAEHFGFASTASAQKHVEGLRRKGWIVRQKHRHRGLIAVEEGQEAAGLAELPLLGFVAAGQPIESLDVPGKVLVPRNLLGTGEHYVLRVRGDSMVDDGILDGDLVIVQARDAARPGEVVIALVEGEVTLKRLFPESGGTVRLQPANAAMEPIRLPADRVGVQGVVVGLMRRYA